MPPHPLTNFELQKYYKNKSKFNGVFSRDNLPNKIEDGAYITNIDEYSDMRTHWAVLYVKKKKKKKVILLILIVLVWNIFQNKFKNWSKIKILNQIFLEYKHMIQ